MYCTCIPLEWSKRPVRTNRRPVWRARSSISCLCVGLGGSATASSKEISLAVEIRSTFPLYLCNSDIVINNYHDDMKMECEYELLSLSHRWICQTPRPNVPKHIEEKIMTPVVSNAPLLTVCAWLFISTFIILCKYDFYFWWQKLAYISAHF